MMDPDTREFKPVKSVDQASEGWPTFTIGQEVVVNGVKCSIRKITKKDIILRPKKNWRVNDAL